MWLFSFNTFLNMKPGAKAGDNDMKWWKIQRKENAKPGHGKLQGDRLRLLNLAGFTFDQAMTKSTFAPDQATIGLAASAPSKTNFTQSLASVGTLDSVNDPEVLVEATCCQENISPDSLYKSVNKKRSLPTSP
jgi:hypothetical protein